MKFNELGFSPETTATEAIVQEFLDSNFTTFNPGGFDLSLHYMSDRQCLKRMSLKRANTPSVYPAYGKKDEDNGDYLTDEDVNKMIYGTDLKKLQEASYVMYMTDNEDLNPSVVSDRLDGVKTDRSEDDDSDSPFKPIRREDKSFEDIYFLKKQLKDDFYRLEYLNKEFQDDLNYIVDLVKKAASFKNLSYYYPSDYTISTTYPFNAGGWSPITTHNNFSISAIYSIYQNCNVLIRENKKRLGEVSGLLRQTQYLDFIIKPESISIVNSFLSTQLTKLSSYKVKFEVTSKYIDDKIGKVSDAQSKIESIDNNIKNTIVSIFAANPSGSVNPYNIQRQLYESSREKYEKDKQKLIDKLNSDLEKGISVLSATLMRP